MTAQKIEPHCYCYEWHTPAGITRSLRSAPRNGANCDTVVALYTADQLAAAVAAERERCAQVCDRVALAWDGEEAPDGGYVAKQCADALRGACPSDESPKSRDPQCMVCWAIAARAQAQKDSND